MAYFVSPHGFGHAARAAAVMEAVGERLPSVCFHIFTTVPPWFFKDSLTVSHVYHPVMTDLGMIQETALDTDLSKTVSALNDFLPFAPDRIADLALTLKRFECCLVICDIAPMGIAVADAAGLSSLLVENFTWDWIYRETMRDDDAMKRHADYLEKVFSGARFHIQTEPVCHHDSRADIWTQPVSRKRRTPRATVRQRLGVPQEKKAVLITMGGIGQAYSFADHVLDQKEVLFVVPDGADVETRIDNLILLPRHSRFYHPDIVGACDAVIGKLGYSTVAEIYHSGIPFGYVQRPDFPESQKLADFVEKRMIGMPIEKTTWQEGRWTDILDELLQYANPGGAPPEKTNGAQEIATFIIRLLQEKGGAREDFIERR
jgi:hypothetical protein